MQKPLTTEVTVKWMCAGGYAPAYLLPSDEATQASVPTNTRVR